ncbi:FAS1 domain [Macleaya cordata]|uniref:FAS1 domain n=1 Tax=Macleaya cordata TaxID=56857 RepID=A0A200PV97_MACCD|nr:FAS1 domain [Macleaya cordata]
MASKFLLIFFFFFFTTLTTITSATPSTPPNKTQINLSKQQLQFQNIIETLMSSNTGNFSNWAVVLSATFDPSRFPLTATFFIPSNNALSNITASQFLQFDSLTLAYHIIPQKLPFSLLQNFKIGSRIPTLLPNQTILVTNNSESNFTIDNSQITHPDLYINGAIAVHGIGSLLNYSVFGGGGLLQDHQISNPSSSDNDDQSPELPKDDGKKPMGPPVKSNGWSFRLTPKNLFEMILFFVMLVLGWILEYQGLHTMFELSLTAVLTATPSSLSLQRSGSRFKEVSTRIIEAFVPEGFPSSVTPDYVPFQIWDSLQGLSTYIRTMLSTQALLSAIGVGEKSATVIGATFQWFLRDFTGMLGGILFTFYQGSNLDSNAKTWRLVADLMNDLGMLMDLVSPLFPSAFVVIVCLGSISRSFTGVASGATRAALTQHFSLQNNAADISAKEGSQETVATMTGMILGMLLAHITMGHSLAIWFSFLSLTMFHMYANYRAVRCLSLTTLNFERSSILLQHFMETFKVLSPQQVSSMEHILPSWTSLWRSKTAKLLHKRIHLGVRVSSLKHSEMMNLSESAGSYYKKAKYLLMVREGVINVIMHKQSTAADILQSFVHALVMVNLDDRTNSAHGESLLWMDENYADFIAKLKSSGWKTERLLAPSIVWRANWLCEPNKKIE